MEKDEILALVLTYGDLVAKIKSEVTVPDFEKIKKQINPQQHDVMDVSLRQDKNIVTEDSTGADRTEIVKVNRISLPLQKEIVNTAATFLCGNPIKLAANPINDAETSMLGLIKRVWKKNKLDYISKELAAAMMRETEAAEIWFFDDAEPGYWAGTANEKDGLTKKIRVKVLARSKGDTFYPVYNTMGDMVAFCHEYSNRVNGKEIKYFDTYMADAIYKGQQGDAGYVGQQFPNSFGKIPVIYYSQSAPEWDDIQTSIDRFEELKSNHGDTNDYFSSPMVKVSGEIKGFAKKGERGKVIELVNGATADYMSWDQSPKSLELEYQELRKDIYDMTHTPNLSFDNIKGLGVLSGTALKFLFIGAHMKASSKEEIFGQGIQRRLNFIMAAMAAINTDFIQGGRLSEGLALDVTPVFEYYLPKDEAGYIDMLTLASGGNPIMSQKTAVSLNPLVVDADKEIELMNEEGLDNANSNQI